MGCGLSMPEEAVAYSLPVKPHLRQAYCQPCMSDDASSRPSVPVQPINKPQSHGHDLCLCYAASGAKAAEEVYNKLTKVHNFKVWCLDSVVATENTCATPNFGRLSVGGLRYFSITSLPDAARAEIAPISEVQTPCARVVAQMAIDHIAACIKAVILVVSAGCTWDETVLSCLRAAHKLQKHLVIVHAVERGPYPLETEWPADIQPLLGSKQPISFISHYSEAGTQKIAEAINTKADSPAPAALVHTSQSSSQTTLPVLPPLPPMQRTLSSPFSNHNTTDIQGSSPDMTPDCSAVRASIYSLSSHQSMSRTSSRASSTDSAVLPFPSFPMLRLAQLPNHPSLAHTSESGCQIILGYSSDLWHDRIHTFSAHLKQHHYKVELHRAEFRSDSMLSAGRGTMKRGSHDSSCSLSSIEVNQRESATGSGSPAASQVADTSCTPHPNTVPSHPQRRQVTYVYFVAPGLQLSGSCLLSLQEGLALGFQVLVVADASYYQQLSDACAEGMSEASWKALRRCWRNRLLYHPEYHEPFLKALVAKAGPPSVT